VCFQTRQHSDVQCTFLSLTDVVSSASEWFEAAVVFGAYSLAWLDFQMKSIEPS
jgi:hypothetical protein